MIRFLPSDLKPMNPAIRAVDKINHNRNPEAGKGVRFGKWLNRSITTRLICWTAVPASAFGAAIYHATSFVVKTPTTPFTVWFSKARPDLGFKDWGKHALKVGACVISFFASPIVSLIPAVGPEWCVKMNVKLGLASLPRDPINPNDDAEEADLIDDAEEAEEADLIDDPKEVDQNRFSMDLSQDGQSVEKKVLDKKGRIHEELKKGVQLKNVNSSDQKEVPQVSNADANIFAELQSRIKGTRIAHAGSESEGRSEEFLDSK